MDEKRMLREIVETHNIIKTDKGAAVKLDEKEEEIDIESPVSMNMWGLQPGFFEILEKGFSEFLSQLNEEDLKSEYLLPTIIGALLKQGKVQVKVLESKDKWFGVTYKEDKEGVVAAIRDLIDKGEY